MPPPLHNPPLIFCSVNGGKEWSPEASVGDALSDSYVDYVTNEEAIFNMF